MLPRSSRRRPRRKKGFILYAFGGLLIMAGAILVFSTWGGNIANQGKNGEQSNVQISPPPSSEPEQPKNESEVHSPEPSAPVPDEDEEESKPQTAEQDSIITMTFVGDVMMSDKVEGILQQNGYDYPYTHVKSYFQQADLAIANLETPITTGGTRQAKEYSYRSSPLALPPLADAGIDLVNLANNHSMDRGPDGLLDTIKHLDENGILHVGAGENIDEAYKAIIIEKKGVKIAFLGMNRVIPDESWKATKSRPGMTQVYEPTLAVESIKLAKEQADLVVVITHWGVEREDMPVQYQKDLARRFIDAGADLIVGSHPHVLQGFEQYKGKWIAYSLGNFIFTTNDNSKTWNSAILQAECTADGACELNVVPVLTKYALPQPMKGDQAAKLLNHLSSISLGAAIEHNGDDTGKVVAK